MEDVVTDGRVLYRACQMNIRREGSYPGKARTDTVIDTDIVADDCSPVTDIGRLGNFPGIADQDHAAFVIVAVIILDHRVRTVPVRIESLGIPGSPYDH